MYGYYDRETKEEKWSKRVAAGVGALALGAALLNRKRVAEWATRQVDSFADNAVAQKYAKGITKFALDTAESFQDVLRNRLKNTESFRDHFTPQEFVLRPDHIAVQKAREELPVQEWERQSAKHFTEIMSRIDSSTGNPTWSPDKIEALLEDSSLFRSLINGNANSQSEISNRILRGDGRFQEILRKEAEGSTFQERADQAVKDIKSPIAQNTPRPGKGDDAGVLFLTLKDEFGNRLRAEAEAKPSAAARLTGLRLGRVSEKEAGMLRGNYGVSENSLGLAGSVHNARYEIGDKTYDFSALRSIFLSTKDVLSDRVSVPFSLLQQGLSLGQTFPFVSRSGENVVDLLNEGFTKDSSFQVSFGKKIISMDAAGAVSTLPGEYKFPSANKLHIRELLKAQREAGSAEPATGNLLSKAYSLFKGGLGDIEPGTTPYWDKFHAFIRKFNAKDYTPNLLSRAAKGDLESKEDTFLLSKILRESSLKVSTEDLKSLIEDMSHQMLTPSEAYGTGINGGTPLIRTPDRDEIDWGRDNRRSEGFPRFVDEGIFDWANKIEEGEGSEYAKYARAYDSMHDFLKNTHLSSPKLARIDKKMFSLGQGDRQRFLAQTVSYEDSRNAETLFGLDLTLGSDRITNLDILRGEMLAGLQKRSFDSLNGYTDISERALARGQTHASFLAQSFNVDLISQGNEEAAQHVNEYLRAPEQETLRSYLKSESSGRFSFLHVHPKLPKEEGQFGDRHKVIPIRTSREDRDGFLGLKRTFRAHTSATSVKDEDTTNASLFSYFIVRRLHSAFEEIGLGLPAAMKASTGRMAIGLIALRYVPIFLGIPEAHKFVNRVTRDVPFLRFLNPDTHRANVLDAASRLSHRGGLRRKALALIPGLDFYTDDRSKSDEDRAQRGAGYTPVRKGRGWAFGSREAFFGEKISYYAPSAARIARSDYQAAENVNRNNLEYWKHFGGFLNPMNWGEGAYWQEKINAKERPYLISGPAFDPGHPWSAILNTVLGRFFKPTRIYHPEYLPKHLGGTLEDTPAVQRQTSPFYGKPPYNSYLQKESHNDQVRGNNTQHAPGQYPPNEANAPQPASGTKTGVPNGNAGVQQNGRGTERTQSFSPRKALPPGYSLSVPRTKRIKDPQYNPLLDRINLFRDLRNANRLKQTDEAGRSSEETAYLNSINMPGGLTTSVYHLQEIAGLYGWFGSLARPQIGHPVGKVEIADASRAYGRERRFYDQEIGGIGGNISDILRRFLPHRRRSVDQYDPVPNNMPSWMPGADNLIDFTKGDPYIKTPLGELRLPGAAYERLHPGTAARMFRMRASSLGKSQAEMESFLVKKEGDGRAGAAAELGTKMHRVLQDRWRALGIMEADEVEVFDPELNVTGHIDAILRIPDRYGRQQRVIADIKTKTAEKYANVVRTGKPEDENLDQLLFYMKATGIKRGLLTYVNRDDVRQVHQIEIKFDKARLATATARLQSARAAVQDRIRSGTVSAGDLYDPLTKYEILSDVAPYSKEFAKLKEWAEHSREAMSNEDQKRLEDAEARVKRVKGGFEIHPYRFRSKPTKLTDVKIDSFVDRQTFVDTSGQTYKIAGINADRTRRLDTTSDEEWWENNTGLRKGSRVSVSTESSSAPPKRIIAAAVLASGRNVGRDLLRKGAVEEDRDDYSEPAKLARFSRGEVLFGRVAEFLLHQNNPVATKFFPVRSGLEQYERTDVYGKKSASWESPVSSYVYPTIVSFTNKNPLAAAAMGGLLGATFFAYSEQRVPAIQIVSVAAVGLSIFGLIMRTIGKPFIPLAVQRRRKMDTYYDNLTYVKYRRLAAQETLLARHKENIEVDDLEGDKLQNVDKENKDHVEGLLSSRRAMKDRRLKLQTQLKGTGRTSPGRLRRIRNQIQGLDMVIARNKSDVGRETSEGRYPVGPHAAQALLYRQRYRATMRGALDSGSWNAAISSLPKTSRTSIVDVINNGSQRDKTRLFSILPDDQKAVMGYALNVEERKIPKMQQLTKYFKSNALPAEDWEGWRSDTSLELLKARDIVTGHKHLDPMDFGIFPSTVETAQQGSPEASISLPRQAFRSSDKLQQVLHDLLVGHGLSGVHVDVSETEHGGDGHEADVDMQVDQRREHAFFQGFKRHAQKGAFTPS